MQEDVIEMIARAGSPRSTASRNPIWSHDETVLLLDLYLRVGRAGPGHAAVQGVSDTLRRLAERSGHPVGETYRNAEGVAMKLKAMAQQDPDFRATGRKGLRAVRIDATVWRQLAGDPEGLAADVRRIASALAPVATDRQPVESLALRTARSRGPAPSFGTFVAERFDSECVVYILRFEGPIPALFPPGRAPDGWIVAKLGRTNDVDRRIVELSAGFPPGANLGWRVLETITLSTAGAAQTAEQSLLTVAEDQGWTLGGEFVVAPEAALLAELRALAGSCAETTP